MSRATGKIIHRDHWDNQLVEVIDNGDKRSLYFAGNVLQSAMSLSRPHTLALSYTRYMMASLLFNEAPEKILLIGVGAGSLLRYIHHYLPKSLVDGIDYSEHIFNLAKGYFRLPDSRRISLYCSDGREYLSDLDDERYDLILVDAFDHSGMSPSIYCLDFFNLCRTHLNKYGMVSLNLWSGDSQKMRDVKSDLGNCFESVMDMPVPNRGNVVSLASMEPKLYTIMEKDYSELTRLSREFDINFREIVKICVKNNLGFRQRLARLFS